MKKILLSSMLASSLLLASDQNYIEIGGGVRNLKDNFSTDSANKTSGLNSAKKESLGFAYVDFLYGYDLNDSANIYIQSGIDGVRIGSNYKNFNFGFKSDISEEWQNPFLIGTTKAKTDVLELGLYVAYKFSIDGIYEGVIKEEISKVKYDKESVSTDLRREGYRYKVSLENSFMSKIFDKDIAYLANVSYENYGADGKASSYDKFDFVLGSALSLNKNVELSLQTKVGKLNYDQMNAQVNKKVDADIYGVEAVLKWDKPFEYKDAYISFITAYEQEDANVAFYDKENSFALLSVGYRF